MDTTRWLDTQRQRRRGEPRASRLPPPRNVSAPASCAFYGVADAHFRCRYPRSCTDCLAMPGCMLLFNGSCVDAVMNGAYVDAMAAAAANWSTYNVPIDSPIKSPYGDTSLAWFASNTSYCDPSDATCAICRPAFYALGRVRSWSFSFQSSFCIGEGGCVCTGVCEVPSYRDSRVREPGCGPPARPPRGPRAVAPRFVDARRDPRATLPPRWHQETEHNESDSCAFLQPDIRTCRQPRSPTQCLRKEGCMIRRGQCIDATGPVDDLRNTSVVDNDKRETWRLASQSTGVCARNDAACRSCVDDLKSYFSYPRLVRCVGTSGCLCLPLMEQWSEDVVERRFDSTCGLWDAGKPNPVTLFGILGTAVVVSSALLLIAMQSQNRRDMLRAHATYALRYMLDHVPRGLDLDLFGWRRFQRTLWHHEQRLLAGEEILSPVVRPMELKDLRVPTAPAFEEIALSSAPTQHDPMALASAPVFRVRTLSMDTAIEDDGIPQGPSAPDYRNEHEAAHGPV